MSYEDPSDRLTRRLLALFLLVAGAFLGWQGYRGVFVGEMDAQHRGGSDTLAGEDANMLGRLYLAGGTICVLIGGSIAVRSLRR